jgi:hypothetical protein
MHDDVLARYTALADVEMKVRYFPVHAPGRWCREVASGSFLPDCFWPPPWFVRSQRFRKREREFLPPSRPGQQV